ncbi:MAG TPA: GyrI-like domain-containing protein [Acidobacteriaceae bacterium]|jgi:predicted transcriptional regulator YdeE|nr:GyrI-like domain-containing protein [Acidobacteriaceae bacterium]
MFAAIRNTALCATLTLAASGFAQTAATPAQQPASPAPAAPAAPAAPKIEDQPSFTVVGVTVRTNNTKEAGGQGEIPQLWQNAMQNGTLDQVQNKADDGLIVVYSDYASDNTGDYNYTLGYKVTSADKVPSGLVAKTVHAGKYSLFTSDQGAPQEVIPALWQRINTSTPNQMGGTRAYQTDYETYGNVVDFGNMQVTAHIGLK